MVQEPVSSHRRPAFGRGLAWRIALVGIGSALVAVGIITAPDGGLFLRFDSDASCALEWRRRLFDDPDYKGGVYARTTTLNEMLGVYAPSGDVHPVTGLDNADVNYLGTVVTMLMRFSRAEGDRHRPFVPTEH